MAMQLYIDMSAAPSSSMRYLLESDRMVLMLLCRAGSFHPRQIFDSLIKLGAIINCLKKLLCQNYLFLLIKICAFSSSQEQNGLVSSVQELQTHPVNEKSF